MPHVIFASGKRWFACHSFFIQIYCARKTFTKLYNYRVSTDVSLPDPFQAKTTQNALLSALILWELNAKMVTVGSKEQILLIFIFVDKNTWFLRLYGKWSCFLIFQLTYSFPNLVYLQTKGELCVFLLAFELILDKTVILALPRYFRPIIIILYFVIIQSFYLPRLSETIDFFLTSANGKILMLMVRNI